MLCWRVDPLQVVVAVTVPPVRTTAMLDRYSSPQLDVVEGEGQAGDEEQPPLHEDGRHDQRIEANKHKMKR